MKFKMDNEVHALYVEIHEGEVAQTVEVDPGVYADFDSRGKVIGMEFVNADDFTRFIGSDSSRENTFVELEELIQA